MSRNQKGFTLVEILVVVFILGILVAIVTVSLVGFMGRGAEAAYNADARDLQTAVSAFYADGHASIGWCGNGTAIAQPVFPTECGDDSDLGPGEIETIAGQRVHRLVHMGNNSYATDPDVEGAAIWMGLLVNAPGSGQGDGKDLSAPLAGEKGPYINGIPESCSLYNSNQGKGSYTWIVGFGGKVYGVFKAVDDWYIGFIGTYP